MAGGPIPVSEILAYCELTEIDDQDEREFLLICVREMDATYLRLRADERNREVERRKASRGN